MKRPIKLVLTIIVLVIPALGYLTFYVWKQGTPYQDRFVSPNGQYYIQKYSNFSLTQLMPMMPGQGSDGINGYIRLYDKNDKLIHERYENFIRDVEPVWDNNKVYLLGIAEMDNNPWVLPTSAQ